MGMFDTFSGQIKCPHCDELHIFEEQTKSYDCTMENFLLGDFIDKANSTYVYTFEAFCNKEKNQFMGNIIIRKGQIVKFANDEELNKIEINQLENIEEGLGLRLNYEEKCKKGLGVANEKSTFNEPHKIIGDRIVALNNSWLIIDVFKETFKTDEYNRCASLHRLWYKDNFVYKVRGELGNRYIRITSDYIDVLNDNGEQNEFDGEKPDNYFIQYGCFLEKIGGI